MLPKDPVILLSYVNTRLRDGCTSLEDFCLEEDADPVTLTERLAWPKSAVTTMNRIISFAEMTERSRI